MGEKTPGDYNRPPSPVGTRNARRPPATPMRNVTKSRLVTQDMCCADAKCKEDRHTSSDPSEDFKEMALDEKPSGMNNNEKCEDRIGKDKDRRPTRKQSTYPINKYQGVAVPALGDTEDSEWQSCCSDDNLCQGPAVVAIGDDLDNDRDCEISDGPCPRDMKSVRCVSVAFGSKYRSVGLCSLPIEKSNATFGEIVKTMPARGTAVVSNDKSGCLPLRGNKVPQTLLDAKGVPHAVGSPVPAA